MEPFISSDEFPGVIFSRGSLISVTGAQVVNRKKQYYGNLEQILLCHCQLYHISHFCGFINNCTGI